MFDRAQGAAEMLGEAHLRAAPWLEAPLVARHIGVWPSAAANPQLATDPKDYDRRRRDWSHQINALMRALQSGRFGFGDGPAREIDFFGYRSSAPAPFVEDATASGGVALVATSGDRPRVPAKLHRNSIIFPIRWRGLDGVVQADRRAEFLSVTTIFDPIASTLGADADPLAARLALSLHAMLAQASSETSARTAATMVYDEIWTSFEADVDGALATGEFSASLGDDVSIRSGDLFADFRLAAVLQGGDVDDAAALEPQLWAAEEARQHLQSLKAQIRGALAPNGPRELVGCTVLDGAAIFLSNTGSPERRFRATIDECPAPKDDISETNTRNVFIFKRPLSSAQLGRLVERTFAIETNRVAALRDIDKIKRSSRELRFQDRKLDGVMLNQYTRASATQRAKTLLEVEDIADEIFKISADGGDRRPEGGLVYRITRSARYVEIFDTRIKHMRTGRIETWQPYEDFMHRRLRITFHYIQRVGERRQSLLDRINVEISLMQTVETSLLQQDTAKNSIATEHLTIVVFIVSLAAFGMGVSEDFLPDWFFDWLGVPSALRLAVLAPAKLQGAIAWAGFGAIIVVAVLFWRRLQEARDRRRLAEAQNGAAPPDDDD